MLYRWAKPELTPNPAYPSLSAKLEVTAGQHSSDGVKVVSKEVMSAGQVVAIEKAVAHSVVNEHKLTNCSHCLETVLVPVPCPGCIDIVFCTASCRYNKSQQKAFVDICK